MKTITLPLNEFLQWSTGHGETYIPTNWALAIAALTNNSPESGYYVQTVSFDGEPMENPMLWRYSAWVDSQQNEERKKAYSQRQRDLRFIFDANVKNVIPYIQKFFGVDRNVASMIATKYVRVGDEQLLQAFGVDKLFTDIKEI